jgi:hypothetical protein
LLDLSPLSRLLFPATERYMGSNTTYPGNWLSIWRKNRRAASPDVLAIYLNKQLSPATMPAPGRPTPAGSSVGAGTMSRSACSISLLCCSPVHDA